MRSQRSTYRRRTIQRFGRHSSELLQQWINSPLSGSEQTPPAPAAAATRTQQRRTQARCCKHCRVPSQTRQYSRRAWQFPCNARNARNPPPTLSQRNELQCRKARVLQGYTPLIFMCPNFNAFTSKN